MSTPDDLYPSEALDTSTTQVSNTPEATQTFEDEVNAIVTQMVQGEDGTWKLPDGISGVSEAVAYAARTEKRRRDTESKLSKTNHALKAKEAEAIELHAKLQQHLATTMTSTQRASLDELKYSDPDKWREELTKLEQVANAKAQEELGAISTAASRRAELERREQLLVAHNASNPGFEITDASLADDIPPRITRKLEKGEVSFEDFLAEASAYLRAGKVVGSSEQITQQPNLGNVGGGAKPSDYASAQSDVASYENQVF